MKLIATITGEGFSCDIHETADYGVEFIADADICADGANGQCGMRPAYAVDNAGSDDLANGGLKMQDGRVTFAAEWGRDVVITGPDGQPVVFAGGVIASKTAYRYPEKSKCDPAAYLDSETVPYIVVPPVIIQRTIGAVMGCRCRVTNLNNGKVVDGIVGDVGPRNKVGEVSIKMARELGIPESPRYGGVDEHIIKYELWPGRSSGIVNARLMKADGNYI